MALLGDVCPCVDLELGTFYEMFCSLAWRKPFVAFASKLCVLTTQCFSCAWPIASERLRIYSLTLLLKIHQPLSETIRGIYFNVILLIYFFSTVLKWDGAVQDGILF